MPDNPTDFEGFKKDLPAVSDLLDHIEEKIKVKGETKERLRALKAVNESSQAIAAAKEILTDEFFKKTPADELKKTLKEISNPWTAAQSKIFKNTEVAQHLETFLTSRKNQTDRYARQIWRTSIVSYIMEQFFAIGLDDAEAAEFTEQIMAGQIVGEEEDEPKEVLKKAAWLDSALQDADKRNALIKGMEGQVADELSGGLADIPKIYGKDKIASEIRVVTGGALLKIPLPNAEKFIFKNMVIDGDRIYAQMKNGCRGNLVIIELGPPHTSDEGPSDEPEKDHAGEPTVPPSDETPERKGDEKAGPPVVPPGETAAPKPKEEPSTNLEELKKQRKEAFEALVKRFNDHARQRIVVEGGNVHTAPPPGLDFSTPESLNDKVAEFARNAMELERKNNTAPVINWFKGENSVAGSDTDWQKLFKYTAEILDKEGVPWKKSAPAPAPAPTKSQSEKQDPAEKKEPSRPDAASPKSAAEPARSNEVGKSTVPPPDETPSREAGPPVAPPEEKAPAHPAENMERGFVEETPDGYTLLITEASIKYGVPTNVLSALLWQESRFDPLAKSKAGALGLAQFMPETAKQFGINPLNQAEAIDGAARYLKQLSDEFGSTELALAGYNAGEGNVRKYKNKIPPFKETRNYVKIITSKAKKVNRDISIRAKGEAPVEKPDPIEMKKREEAWEGLLKRFSDHAATSEIEFDYGANDFKYVKNSTFETANDLTKKVRQFVYQTMELERAQRTQPVINWFKGENSVAGNDKKWQDIFRDVAKDLDKDGVAWYKPAPPAAPTSTDASLPAAKPAAPASPDASPRALAENAENPLIKEWADFGHRLETRVKPNLAQGWYANVADAYRVVGGNKSIFASHDAYEKAVTFVISIAMEAERKDQGHASINWIKGPDSIAGNDKPTKELFKKALEAVDWKFAREIKDELNKGKVQFDAIQLEQDRNDSAGNTSAAVLTGASGGEKVYFYLRKGSDGKNGYKAIIEISGPRKGDKVGTQLVEATIPQLIGKVRYTLEAPAPGAPQPQTAPEPQAPPGSLEPEPRTVGKPVVPPE